MINYKYIHESSLFYNNKGYQRIEAPWIISNSAESITRPENKKPFQIKDTNECLVGSGEQSFLYLYLKEQLPLGKFQTITPCFRNDELDYFHSNFFIKNELIRTDVVNESALLETIGNAMEFFSSYVGVLKDLTVVEKDNEYDINYKNIEIGSYGIRDCKFLTYIYGTGCAEPRFSKSLKE
jgi:hypothetical protein